MLRSRNICYNVMMKSVAESTIRKYLPSLKVKARSVSLNNLPMFYRGLYSFEEIVIQERSHLLIKVKDKTLGPRDFKKHSKTLSQSLDYPQVWYLEELHFNKVQRMIENELNFIVEDKQVHLPVLNVSIKSEIKKTRIVNQLSGLSINMLIREILVGDLSGKSKVEIAKIFKTTKMSAGRAIEPLLANDLCEEKKIGVAKKIQFRKRVELWKYVQAKVSAPFKQIIYLNKLPKGMFFSGISALSQKTMLADDEIPTLGVDKRIWNKKFNHKDDVLEELAAAKIQLWDRPPILLEKNCINVVDMFLVLKEVTDERVQIELEGLLKKHNLDIG